MIFGIILILIGLMMSFLAVVFSSFAKPSEKQKFSFLATVSALIYFIISFLNIYSDTVDQFVIYQKIIFASGIYMMIGFGLTISYMFSLSYSTRFKMILMVSSIFLVAIFVTFTDAAPWAKSIEMIKDDIGLYTFKVHGDWLYYLLNTLSIVAFVSWVVYIIVKTFREKGREFKVFRYLIVIALIPLFIFIFSLLNIIPSLITNEIVFMIILLIVLHVEIFYSIKFDSKRYIEPLFENSNSALILLDSKKRFIYANNTAKSYFAIFDKNNRDAITAFINLNLVEEHTFNDGVNNYSIVIETIKDINNPRIGYALKVVKENEKEVIE